jgi:hypothetical protein
MGDLQHPNEYIRGSTLRFLCKLREAELLEPLLPSARACLVCVWEIDLDASFFVSLDQDATYPSNCAVAPKLSYDTKHANNSFFFDNSLLGAPPFIRPQERHFRHLHCLQAL